MLMTLNKVNLSALKFNVNIAKTVENICQPLFKNFGITNFGYVRIFQDGLLYRISTDSTWSIKYFENQFYNDTDFYDFSELNTNTSKIRVYTHPPEKCSNIALNKHFNALYEHDIWNICTIYTRKTDYVEVWFFGSTKEKLQLIDFYVNHQKILNDFIEHFKIQMGPFLSNIKKENLISTKLKIFGPQKKANIVSDSLDKEQNKYKFNISKREEVCLQKLFIGKTAKQIAQELKISHRTVEKHIANIKKRTNCRKISQLIYILHEENFFRNLLY